MPRSASVPAFGWGVSRWPVSRPRLLRPPPVSVRRSAGTARTGLLVMEAPRASVELGALMAAAPLLAAGPRGDGHPVLVLPGLFGGDLSTLPLRRYLRWLNYSVSGWGLGANVGSTEAVVSGLRARLERLADDSGRRVSLVGWSLGGLYALDLARRAPGSVRQVLTLGSPVRLARRARATSRVFDRLSDLQVTPSLVARPWSEAGSLRVPATAVYTRSDAIVGWQSCLLSPGKRRENVEVYGSHYGLAHNPAVLHVLADRLAQPEHRWRAFAPGVLVRHAYP